LLKSGSCLLWLCFIALMSAPRSLAEDVGGERSFHLQMTGNGFCLNGVPLQVQWLGEQVKGLVVWGSYCTGDGDTGRIESGPFLAPAKLSLFISGYAGTPSVRLALQSLQSGQEMELHPQPIPREHWQRSSFDLPPEWSGKPVRIIAEDRATGPGGWLAFTEPILPYSSVAVGAIPTDRPQRGFCAGGVFQTTDWPRGVRPAGAISWGSFCESGDGGTGWMASKVVAAGQYLMLYLAGYPGSAHLRLAVENLQTGHQLPLQIESPPREAWRLYHFPLPSGWKGQPIRVLAEDEATGPTGWVGFTEPFTTPSLKNEFSFAGRILGLVVLLFLVLMLPAAAAASLAFLRGVVDPVDLTAVGLVALAFVGYSSFWIYLLSRKLGVVYTYLVLLSACAVIVYACLSARSRVLRFTPLRRMIEPLLLVALAAIFVISLGFVYGKPESVQTYAAQRFEPPTLPIDNFLPKIFADNILMGKIPKPMIGDWLSSDRPPLQTGLVLWTYAFTHGNRDLSYQVTSTILQVCFLAGLWAYLNAAGVNRKAMALVLATGFFSVFAVFHSFFTWPKLLPVAFLLIIAAYLFTDRYHLIRGEWRVGALLGALAAFAMLCHGGSMFALLGMATTLLLVRRVPSFRVLLATACAAGLLYLPWSLYQKYYDPPGDRLLKWHLAGTVSPHPEARFRNLLITSYGQLGGKGILEYKIENFSALADDIPAFWQHIARVVQTLFTHDLTQRAAAVAWLRLSMFCHWFASIDFLSVAPIALLLCAALRLQNSVEFQQGWILWLCTTITLVLWCLLMFGPGMTLVHQGCFFTEITAFAGGVLCFWVLSPRLAAVVTACHIAFGAALFCWLTPPTIPGFATFMGPANPALGCACFAAAGGFALVLWHIAFGRSGYEKFFSALGKRSSGIRAPSGTGHRRSALPRIGNSSNIGHTPLESGAPK